jgi:hypothetical protein
MKMTILSHQAHMKRSLAMDQDLLGVSSIKMNLTKLTINWHTDTITI